VVLPRLMYGMEVLDMTEEEVQKMQRMENGVMRRILRAPTYAAVAGLQGEIGIGTMKSRMVRARLQYLRRKMQGEDSLVGRMMESLRRTGGRSKWMEKTRKYLEWAEIGEEEVIGISKDGIKQKIAARVEEEWRKELEGKSTLAMYRVWKTEMEEEDYDGGQEARLWLRARLNCLELGERKRFEGGDTRCTLCGEEVEDRKHVIMDCESLEEERREEVILQRPREENEEEILGRFLFEREGQMKRRAIFHRMWLSRARRRRE